MGGLQLGASTVRRLATSIGGLAGCLLLGACGGKSAATTVRTPQPASGNASAPAASVPELASLPTPAGPGRQLAAETPFELLSFAPVVASGNGSASWSSGQLSLTPDVSGAPAWAVFGLLAFPPDGSVYPLKVEGESGALWVGLSNFATGRWEWHPEETANAAWQLAYGAGADYVSPSGGSFVALVRLAAGSHSYTSLRLSASDQLFAPPVPDLTTSGPAETGGRLIEGYTVTFDFSGSNLGGGALVSATFRPETGAPPVDLPNLTTPYGYIYDSGGVKAASLTLVTEKSGIQETSTQQFPVTIIAKERELLVVYNSNIPASQDLANYYMSPLTGRNVDADYQLGLPLEDSASFNQTIDRATYASTIREPIKAFLDDPEHAAIQANVKYLLLMKGVPHKISGAGEFSETADCSSVDSELCCLYSDHDNIDGLGTGYPLQSWLWNRSTGFNNFEAGESQSFWLGTADFARHTYKVAVDPTWEQFPDDPTSDDTLFDLDYLVGRIDGYSFTDAKAIIDRALQADTSGTGWVVFDSAPADYGQGYDTMVDPVWPYTLTDTPRPDSGEQLLRAAGINVWADVTSDRILATGDWATRPPDFQNRVIGYAGWGTNHSGGSYPSGANYILNDLGWNYLPGACFSSYESFNATTLYCSDENDPTIGHPGQGEICDFLHEGGTVAVGNAWEPFTLGCVDERWFFDRYLNHGDRFIEAAYKGLRLISWMEVVIGDPLCRVRP